MDEPTFFPISRSALLITVGDRIDRALTHRIARFVDAIDESRMPGLVDIIPSYTTILMLYDENVNRLEALENELSVTWRHVQNVENRTSRPTVVIPVIYGDEFGEDLPEVAAHHHLPVEEVIERHVGGAYTVGALGFSPGFAYLIGLESALATPRRSRPRTRVPSGSIGIGGEQTGIYALESPGGWNLIGRTPETLFNPDLDDPFPLHMGDKLRFERLSSGDVDPSIFESPQRNEELFGGQIDVLSPGMQTTVQDLGRHGYGRFGFAPNGAADRTSLIGANRAVGNPDDAAGLEITFTGPTLVFLRRSEIAVHGADLGAHVNGLALPVGRVQGVMPGDELSFHGGSGGGARAYLAVAGGIDVPVVMGSRSTDLTAAIGGYRGRALRTGDRLPIGRLRRHAAAGSIEPTRLDPLHHIEVIPGPQADQFDEQAWQTLLSHPFRVSPASNRMGLRLDGPAMHPADTADIISEGIVTGSIQITGEGQPIVMLPGHATIGGYTKIATVTEDDLDRLGQLRPGDELRFTSRYRTS
jgi:KipI family sensor histidine kinase inhibitor